MKYFRITYEIGQKGLTNLNSRYVMKGGGGAMVFVGRGGGGKHFCLQIWFKQIVCLWNVQKKYSVGTLGLKIYCFCWKKIMLRQYSAALWRSAKHEPILISSCLSPFVIRWLLTFSTCPLKVVSQFWLPNLVRYAWPPLGHGLSYLYKCWVQGVPHRSKNG